MHFHARSQIRNRESYRHWPKLCNRVYNLLRPSAAYMRQQIIPSLVQIIACRLFGDNPFNEPMIVYCQINCKEHIWMKFYLKYKSFLSRKCAWKCHLPKWRSYFAAAICLVNACYDQLQPFHWATTGQQMVTIRPETRNCNHCCMGNQRTMICHLGPQTNHYSNIAHVRDEAICFPANGLKPFISDIMRNWATRPKLE